MAKTLKFKHFVETLLQIIEDKSKQDLPFFFYYTLILIMYCQFAGYIFSTYETKALIDPNIRYFAHIMEYSPGTFLLFVTGNDTLTLFVFVIFEICLYGYIIYIILLTYLRIYNKEIVQKFKAFFKAINFFLQIFFSTFLWIFYIPFTEIHSGIAVCGSNSFLTAYQGDDGCLLKPTYQIMLGVSGVILTFFTGCLLNYFYVSYEFEERNLLKRRFSWNLILQMLARSLLVALYYLNLENIALIKHITSHILGITSCFDIIVNIPFRNKNVMLVYGTATFTYEATMVLFSVWNLTDLLPEYNLFYYWCFLIPLNFGLMYSYWNYSYNSLMKLDLKDLGKYYFLCDRYLEEISSLSMKSDKIAKVHICGILRNHLNNCNEPLCIFQKNSVYEHFLDKNFQMESFKLIKVINNWFTILLNHQLFKNRQGNKEYLSLKYCSFLANFQDNPIRAYYELKSLLNRDKKQDEKSTTSLFFRLLSKIISKNIENLILQQIRYERGFKPSDDLTRKHEFFYSASLYKLEKFKRKYVISIIDVVNCKKEFWERLLNGYNSINEYNEIAFKLCTKINRLKNDFRTESRDIQRSKDKENIIFLKLSSIFNTVILNDILGSYKIETKILETKKRESLISKEFISSISIVKGNSIAITASLLNETGKIMSIKNEKTAAFFGYSFKDFENINNISSFMPQVIAKEHPKMIARYIENGRSDCVRNSRLVFCKSHSNWIFPTKIFYNFIFDYVANFGICASITKIETSSFFILFDDQGIISGVSKNFKEKLKIKDANKLFDNSNYNILHLVPNLFDNTNFSTAEQKKIDGKDEKIMLINREKLWFYPTKCEIKIFLENFKEFTKNRDSTTIDLKKEENRNLFKNFLISEDSKSNLRKVLASGTLIRIVNNLNEGLAFSKFVLEINELFLNQMQDPDQSTGLKLTEELTNNSKTKLKQNEKDSDENSNDLIKNDYVINQSQSNEIKNILIENIQNEQLQLNSEQVSQNLNSTPDEKDFITPMNELRAPNQIPIKFEQAIQKSNNDVSIYEESSLQEFEDKVINENNKYPLKSSEILEVKKEKLKTTFKRSESDENQGKISFSVEKVRNSDFNNDFSRDQLMNAVSVSSGSSLQTNYGSVFLKDLVQGNSNPSIVKKILFISVFQILFFFTINLIYIFLINDRLVSFNVNMQGMEIPHYFLNSFSRNLVASTSRSLQNEGIINKNSSFFDLQNSMQITAYNALQTKIDELNIYYYIVMGIECEINTFSLQIKNNFTLDYFQFLNMIVEFSYMENLTLNLDNFTNDNYYFFLANYDKILYANTKIEKKFLTMAENNKDSLMNFYLILSIIGLAVAIFLQLINIPFFLQYYTLIEKILMLVSRITEKECINEIKIYENYVSKLKSRTDEYLNYEFLLEEKNNKKSFHLSQTSNDKKRTNFSSGYLSSRITNQKLKRINTHLLNILTIMIVTIFFSIVFVLANEIEDLLQRSINLGRNISLLSNSVDILETLPTILISNHITSRKSILSSNELIYLTEIYQIQFDSFKNIYNNILFSFINDQNNQEFSIKLNQMMGENLCEVLSIIQCKFLTDNNFFYGLNGYFSVLIKSLRELKPYIFSTSNFDLNTMDILFNNDNAYQYLLNVLIVFDVRDRFIFIAKQAADDQIDQAYNYILLLFLLGGSVCSAILSIIFLILYFKIKSNYMNLRAILLMIPFKKLREDSTLYLLRNLRKF